jgi:hypothetical protein
MDELRGDLEELRCQLERGSVRRAYVAIVTYLSGLRAHFATTQKEWGVSGLYHGYFDMTYFALMPPSLSARNLKLAVVFDYESFHYQVWLAARNRRVQRHYWRLLRDHGWPSQSLVEPAAGVDAIVSRDVADGLALDDPDLLTAAVEQAVLPLLQDLERFFDLHDPITG